MNRIPQEVLLLAPAVTALIALTTLVYRRLANTYPALFCYFLLEIIQDVTLWVTLRDRHQYFVFWTVFQALGCVVLILVARELLGLLVQSRVGIAVVTRRFYTAALVSAILSAIAVTWFGFAHRPGVPVGSLAWFESRSLVYLKMTFTVALTGTALFLAFAGLFLLWFAVRLQRTVACHYFVFLAYTWVGAAGLMLHHSLGATSASNSPTEAFVTMITVAVFTAWALLLREHRTAPYFQMRQPGPEREQQLLGQLDQINGVLLRTLN